MKKILFLIILSVLCNWSFAQQKLKTENVILITLDGMRWQEIFNGGDSSFMRQQKYLKDGKIKEKFWRDDLNDRRKALLPFFWNTLATKGQLYGNRMLGCKVNVSNNQWFSYPGYSEILTGQADNERINSNDKMYNPNTNVLEFINSQQAFSGKVAAFSSWDVFPYIINDKRSGVMVSGGLVEAKGNNLTEREKTMNDLMMRLPNPLGDVRLDAFTFYYGFEYMKKNKPRVMYFAFDETDDFAHAGEYAAYLNSSHNTDRMIEELWNFIQSDPAYKNKTTMILTCDHGRGANAVEWKDHGIKINAADQIWMGVIGPDTPAKGEVKGECQYYQNQVAQTMASFLGLQFKPEKTVGEAMYTMLK
jgi:predicted AlkP superfamily pyrophosphatase or phosphodiesterase